MASVTNLFVLRFCSTVFTLISGCATGDVYVCLVQVLKPSTTSQVCCSSIHLSHGGVLTIFFSFLFLNYLYHLYFSILISAVLLNNIFARFGSRQQKMKMVLLVVLFCAIFGILSLHWQALYWRFVSGELLKWRMGIVAQKPLEDLFQSLPSPSLLKLC